MKLGTVLIVALVILAAVSALVLIVELANSPKEYTSIDYSFTRITLRYDYSCDENVYGLYLTLTNGNKTVEDFQVAITNGLCVGSVPPLPSSLNASQTIRFYVYSSNPNGTITLSGNDTDLLIRF